MRLPPLELCDEDRPVLERRVRSKTACQRDVTRAHIVLMAADGRPNAGSPEMSASTSGRWAGGASATRPRSRRSQGRAEVGPAPRLRARRQAQDRQDDL